jgi:hypothetical protein
MLLALAEVMVISLQLHGRSTVGVNRCRPRSSERRGGNYDTSSAAVSGGSGLPDQHARPGIDIAHLELRRTLILRCKRIFPDRRSDFLIARPENSPIARRIDGRLEQPSAGSRARRNGILRSRAARGFGAQRKI